MPKNKSIKEDRNNNSDGNIDGSSTPAARGKRDRDSGSEGSPNISKKPLKSNMVSETLYTGVAGMVSGEEGGLGGKLAPAMLLTFPRFLFMFLQ